MIGDPLKLAELMAQRHSVERDVLLTWIDEARRLAASQTPGPVMLGPLIAQLRQNMAAS